MTTLFDEHFEKIAARLTAESDIAKSFSHNTNKGNIREAFVKEFLTGHLPDFCGVGSGEIIHHQTEANEKRNQLDVILHSSRYPKLPGAAGVDLYFVETVSSVIEVKSVLTKEELRKAVQSSKKIKQYPNNSTQKFNPNGMIETIRPYTHVFAYECEVSLDAILGWMKELSEEDDYNLKALMEADPQKRSYFNNLFLDGVFVLNKGFVTVDASPFVSPLVQDDKIPRDHIWIYGDNRELQVLWAYITDVAERFLWCNAEMVSYLANVERAISN